MWHQIVSSLHKICHFHFNLYTIGYREGIWYVWSHKTRVAIQKKILRKLEEKKNLYDSKYPLTTFNLHKERFSLVSKLCQVIKKNKFLNFFIKINKTPKNIFWQKYINKAWYIGIFICSYFLFSAITSFIHIKMSFSFSSNSTEPPPFFSEEVSEEVANLLYILNYTAYKALIRQKSFLPISL